MKANEIQKGWVWCKLEEVVQINPRHLSNIVPDDLEVSFVPMAALDEDYWMLRDKRTRPFGEVKKGYTHFAEGDVLFAKITPCMENGKAAIARNLVNGIGCGTTELHVLRPEMGIPSEYIYHYVHQESFRERAAASMTGTAGQLRVPVKFMREVPIPLPPLPEQRLIVARVEALLEQVRKAKEALDKVPPIMKRFRQAVLKKAFSGELTAGWRKEHLNLEPAGELLKRIQHERKRRYEEEVRRAKAEGRKPPKKPKHLEMEPLDTSDLPELPEEWVWVRIGDIETFIGSGITPRGGKSNYLSRGIPFIRSQNVWPEGLKLDDIVYISEEQHKKMSRTKVQPYDVLLNITGASIGRATYVPENFTEANVNQHVCIIRTSSNVYHKFLSGFLNSPFGQDQIFSTQAGVTREGLNYNQIRKLRVPLPPLEEQHEIVRRVEALFKFADEVEKRAEEARKRVERITQSILARAFRGELTADFREAVRNWKNLDLEERRKYIFTLPKEEQEKALYEDEFPLEPAEHLLERIRAERAKREGKGTKTRGRRRQSRQLELMR